MEIHVACISFWYVGQAPGKPSHNSCQEKVFFKNKHEISQQVRFQYILSNNLR